MITKNYESIIKKNPKLPLLFCCDHASNLIPKKYDKLELNNSIINSHIAYDIGAKIFTKKIARIFKTNAILGKYSRLFIDLNRSPKHMNLIPKISDDIRIPGNFNLSAKEKKYRINQFHKTYHNELKNMLKNMDNIFSCKTALICIHSFTPSLIDGHKRPWEIGLLYRKDISLYKPILKSLTNNKKLNIGNNKPYSGFEDVNYTMTYHGENSKRPFISIEIRNDIFLKINSKKLNSILQNISKAIYYSQCKLGEPYINFAKNINLF